MCDRRDGALELPVRVSQPMLLNQRHRVIGVSTVRSHRVVAWRHSVQRFSFLFIPYAEPNLPFKNDKTLTFS